MNKNIAKKWIQALRSKRYKQGRNALKVKTKDGTIRHCCLGVLCELYRKETGDITIQPVANNILAARDILSNRTIKTLYGFTTPDRDDYNYMQCLPPAVRKWAEMCDEEGATRDYSRTTKLLITRNGDPLHTLTSINDRGYSFNTIADIIESNTENL